VGKPDNLPWGKVAIINFNGYLDFYPSFIAKGLEEAGLSCSLKSFTLPELETLRKSSTEMRAANIARVIVGDVIGDVAREVNRLAGDADTVLMPAVIGLFDDEPVKLLREKVDRPLYFVSTQPMSVGGMRSQIRLRRYFKKLGGTYLLGDSVTNGVAEGDRMMKIFTVNLGDMELSADYFILASGSFFSYGIMANPVSIYEPIFGLDIKAPTTRSEWYHKDIFKDHAYMKYGVTTDDEFRVMKDGRTLDNMYAVGAVLGGCNSMKEESGAGVALMTSMKVVDNILAR
ncbi:anaerobic glycerol-3-phosphate dehydrogenase subunit GlpB, partial [uncultured Muribaculum sp.]